MTKEEFYSLYETRANNRCDGHVREHYGFWMQQHPAEFCNLVEAVSSIGAKRVLEIGVNHGGSTVFWDHLVGEDGIVVAIDRCGHQGNIMSMFRPEFCDYQPVSDLRLIDGDSHDQESFDKITAIFGEEPIDFLFIDGDHTYEGALMDYEMYGPLVRPGGIIAVDDINMDERVKQAWDEMTSLGGVKVMTSGPESETHHKAQGIIQL